MRQQRMPKRLVAGLAGFALLAAACGDDSDDPDDPVDDEVTEDETEDEEAAVDIDVDLDTDRLVIGRVMPETGPLDFLGPPQIEGIRLAVDDINDAGGVLGQDVELLEADEGPEPPAGRDNVVELLGQGANMIVGAAASGFSQEFIQILFDNGVPQCSPSNTSPAFSEQDNAAYYFRTALPDEAVVDIFVDELIDAGHDRIAIAARADDYGLAYQELMDEGLEAANLEVVYSEAYAEDVATFDAEVGEILDADADAIVFIFFNEGGELLQGLVEQGFDPGNIYGADGVFTPTLPNEVDETDANVIDGMRVIGQGGNEEFNERLSAEVEGGATIYGAQAYDCGIIAALAAERAGAVDETLIEHAIEVTSAEGTECSSFEECRDLLADDEDINYQGAASSIELTDVGDPSVGNYVIAEFQDGELVPVASYEAQL
jgi:ABC-type branched-subunit amino acid transport system substrate-binding protein